MNWDDPAARLALVESVGTKEYNRLITEHLQRHLIRPVSTRFGTVYAVRGTTMAFSTEAEAQKYAAENPEVTR